MSATWMLPILLFAESLNLSNRPQKAWKAVLVSVSVWHILSVRLYCCVCVHVCEWLTANVWMYTVYAVSICASVNSPRCWNWSLPLWKKWQWTIGMWLWQSSKVDPSRTNCVIDEVKWDMRGFLAALWLEAHSMNFSDYMPTTDQQNHQWPWPYTVIKQSRPLFKALSHAGKLKNPAGTEGWFVHNYKHMHSN